MPSIEDFAVFHQDLAYGIPPIIELREILNVPTPMFRMIADVSKLVTGVDYMKEGLKLRGTECQSSLFVIGVKFLEDHRDRPYHERECDENVTKQDPRKGHHHLYPCII